MKLTKSVAFGLAQTAGRTYGFDPFLILAMIEQESSYETEAVRLENGFFRKYISPLSLATTSKVLRSASYGLCQLMGQSLAELGLFDPPEYATPEGTAKRINEYMVSPLDQVMTGAQWLRRKMDQAHTIVIANGLRLYNGSDDYPPQVFARMERLKKEHDRGEF